MHPGTRYGGIYNFNKPVLVLKDPELIKQITVKDFEHFTDHPPFVDPDADLLWSKSLISLKGQRWKEMRNFLSPTFTSSKIKSIYNLILGTTESFVQHLLEKDDQIIEIELTDAFSRFTNDVIATTAFGIQVNSLKDRNNDFYEMGKKITSISLARLLSTLVFSKLFKILGVPFLDRNASKYFYAVIDETIKARQEQTILRPDMIQLMLDARIDKDPSNCSKDRGINIFKCPTVVTIFRADRLWSRNLLSIRFGKIAAAAIFSSVVVLIEVFFSATQLVLIVVGVLFGNYLYKRWWAWPSSGQSKGSIQISNAERTSQAMIFFFGGFDTVSTTMCFGSYELALNQDIQKRLRKEITEYHKKSKVTYDELMQMKYMNMVVSEVLRKWPLFVNINRVCTKAYTIQPVNEDEKPVPIAFNQELWLPVYGLHRDPKYFPNPEKFDPERFSDKNKNNIVPYTYIPFGSGPRNCIGNRFALLKIKALLDNILLNYEIVPIKRTLIPLKLTKGISQIPEEGFWLGLKRIGS